MPPDLGADQFFFSGGREDLHSLFEPVVKSAFNAIGHYGEEALGAIRYEQVRRMHRDL